jgi:hypothetical protein
MKINEIIKITENKLASLRNERSNAVLAGDLELVTSLDDQIRETETTLTKLNTIE